MPNAFDDLSLDDLRRRRSSKWTHYPPDVIPAWVAEMDFPVADPVRRAVAAAAEREDLGYAPFTADAKFGELVAGWADRTYQWKVDLESVVVLPDAVRGLAVGVEALTQPGDGVVIQPPTYPPFFTVVKETGRKLIENPLIFRNGRYEVDLEGLDVVLGRATAIILCNPQNPTGRSFSSAELRAITDLAIKHDVSIISDEIHSKMTLPGARHTVLATLGEEVAARTMTVTSASKAWNFGGLKCGFAVCGTPAMLDKVNALGHLATAGVGILGLVATEAAFTEGDAWMGEVVDYLDGNRHLVADLLKEHLPEVGYTVPEATYFSWLDCRELNLQPDPYTFFLEKAKVALSPGPKFGTQGEGFVRLNFATSRAILTEIVERMARAVRG